MRTSFSWAQFELSSTPHKMLMILGLLAVLLVPLPSLITEAKCGKPVAKSSRVVNGQEATPNSWPWQISLRYRDWPNKNDYGHICGGSLIEEDWVLTAAHCVVFDPDPTAWKVIVGVHYREGSPTSVQETINVTKVICHSEYKRKTLQHDVALLKLAKPITPSDKVDTISLPKSRSDQISPGTNCFITGWGYTTGGGNLADVLQEAMLPVADLKTCRKKMLNKWIKVYKKAMLCAGAQGKGGCQNKESFVSTANKPLVGTLMTIGDVTGDSGGPLSCRENGKWVLRGVVSGGTEMCLTDYFSLFARVSNYVEWIKANRMIDKKLVKGLSELLGVESDQ